MTRLVKLIAALGAAVVLGGVAVQPAFAEPLAWSPSPTPSPSISRSPQQKQPDSSQQLAALEQQLQSQQATVNSLATQVESEQGTVNGLNAKVAADKKQEQLLDQRMDRVARIEYERPALSLTAILDARNLGQLLSGVAQARLIAKQQKTLYEASQALRAKDQQDQAAAAAQLNRISQQKAQATTIAANTQAEITTIQEEQAQQAAAGQSPQGQTASSSTTSSSSSASAHPAPQASTQPAVTAGDGITLQLGPSNPNRFDPGQCTWYVARIYSIPWLGNANQWPAAAAADGQAEGQTPIVGAIMESADSGYGHVSVVTAVASDDQWTVTEMNYLGPFVVDTRQVNRGTSNLVTFIY